MSGWLSCACSVIKCVCADVCGYVLPAYVVCHLSGMSAEDARHLSVPLRARRNGSSTHGLGHGLEVLSVPAATQVMDLVVLVKNARQRHFCQKCYAHKPGKFRQCHGCGKLFGIGCRPQWCHFNNTHCMPCGVRFLCEVLRNNEKELSQEIAQEIARFASEDL